MPDTGTPPAIPPEFQIYNSYEEDPKWQRKFSIIWVSVVGLAILASLPHLLRSIKNGRAFSGFFGITEDYTGAKYTPVTTEKTQHQSPRKDKSKFIARLSVMHSVGLWSLRGFPLKAGQIFVVFAYMSLVLICIVVNAPLSSNSNRAGFIALAQLPVVFLFATKNSLFSLLLGPGNGYEKLNYIHRWAGRSLFFAALLHGSLWIQNHLIWHLPILGQQKETSGVAALSLLGAIVLLSLRPVRQYFYQAFFIIHVMTFVAFFITICYHTKFASPWTFPSLAFYGFDLLLRMLRYRIKDATLTPIGNQLTIIRIANCDDGWSAGQHVRLRVFFSGRFFESHPFTILRAPPAISCSPEPGLLLAARADGDWTRSLNEYARSEIERMKSLPDEKATTSADTAEQLGSLVQVMLDGPYGGCSIDIGEYESVLLLTGGSGATFTLGLLDDVVGRCVKLARRGGEVTKRIEFVWCLRSFGMIKWFPLLVDIANTAAGSSLDLHISIFVTCLCVPEDVPHIPNSHVSQDDEHPSVYDLLLGLVTPPTAECSTSSSHPDVEWEDISQRQSLRWVGLGGGVAVCASGPVGMISETQNAVARLSMSRGVELGGLAFHGELFTL